MAIKYDIHSIHNVLGTGTERQFVHIFEADALTENQLCDRISERCTFNPADVKGVLRALRDVISEELTEGRRFALPDIGYLSLQVGVDLPEGKPMEEVRGNHISVRSVKFRPASKLLREVQRGCHFERSDGTSCSTRYTEAELEAKIRAYLADNDCITSRTLDKEFHIRRSAALKWLARFVETGLLRKAGALNSPVYFLAE